MKSFHIFHNLSIFADEILLGCRLVPWSDDQEWFSDSLLPLKPAAIIKYHIFLFDAQFFQNGSFPSARCALFILMTTTKKSTGDQTTYVWYPYAFYIGSKCSDLLKVNMRKNGAKNHVLNMQRAFNDNCATAFATTTDCRDSICHR